MQSTEVKGQIRLDSKFVQMVISRASILESLNLILGFSITGLVFFLLTITFASFPQTASLTFFPVILTLICIGNVVRIIFSIYHDTGISIAGYLEKAAKITIPDYWQYRVISYDFGERGQDIAISRKPGLPEGSIYLIDPENQARLICRALRLAGIEHAPESD